MVIYTIDGNIGSGKSTILNYLHKYKNLEIDLEPLDKWKSFLDNIYLYKTGFFNFQIKVWLDRAWIQEKEYNSTILMERSPFFIINELYNKTDNIWKSNNYIYLRSAPNNCLERIKKRGRDNEINSITIDYLTDIHLLHEETYNKALEKKYNILIIDVDNKNTKEIIDEIISFIS